MDISTIASVCRVISDFQRRENWTLKAPAVLTFEFSTIEDFMAAKCQLARAVHNAQKWMAPASAERLVDPYTSELDCCGVVFRLVCKQIMHAQGGRPMGAAELRDGIDVVYNPNPGFLDGLGQARKAADY